MTLKELRQPKVNEIINLLQRHQEKSCKAVDFGGFIAGSGCTCVEHRMFLYDLLHHEEDPRETLALNGAPVPEFLQPGYGGWDRLK